MLETVAILCGGRGTRLARRAPEAARRGRRAADRLARGLDLRRARASGARAPHGLPRRAGGRVGGGRARGPRASRSTCVDTGPGHADGRPRPGGRRPRSGRAPSSSPTATAWPTSTSARSAAAHAATGALATMTVVRPELPFGVAVLDAGDRVTGFREKPVSRRVGQRRLPRCSSRRCSGCLDARPPCSSASRSSASPRPGRLHAFRHEGFWACMDTHKDALALNALWDAGRAPWAGK